jgi:hypothetical protein
MFSTFKLGSKQRKVGSDETITDQKLNGKDQLIDQYKLTRKKAGKNTKAIQQDWHNSITMAHTMLVEVNQELSKILKELNEISEKLDKINEKSKSAGAVKKFKVVEFRMKNASKAADEIVKEFKSSISFHLVIAAEKISELKDKDFKNLEEDLGTKEVKKLKDIFQRIKLLQQNINSNAQDANQVAEPSKKKKQELVTESRSSTYESEEYSDDEYDDSSEEEVTAPKKNFTKKKTPSDVEYSESSSSYVSDPSSGSSDSTSSDS